MSCIKRNIICDYYVNKRRMLTVGRRRSLLKLTLWTIYVIGILLLIRQFVKYFQSTVNFSRDAGHWTRSERERYEKWINNYESHIVAGLGDDGKPAELTGPAVLQGKEIIKQKAVNILLSDIMPLNRKLPDVRDPLCATVTYEKSLPTASVIIIFYNEAFSILLRTVRSVLDRSPDYLLKEIILVDDCSDDVTLGGPLEYYINTRLPSKVKLVKLNNRVGLIRARLRGAIRAIGDVLVFLDAHCEATDYWLEPLLQRIKEKRTAVLTPIIDTIGEEKFEYSMSSDYNFQVGGFTWSGHFTWINIQAKDLKSRESKISPVNSPTMAGGLFAIDRTYFWEIGSYDDKMDGWGGENLEMSFRVWQCGGSLETIPCSRVGHIFRNFHPYKFPNDKDTHGINTARLVHVWMDEYKRLFFMHRDEYKDGGKNIGDLTERLKLRDALKCKSFKWYLDNVYPEIFIPDENVVAYGRLKLKNQNICIDNLQRDEDNPYYLGLYLCHGKLFPSQLISLSNNGELRREERCAIIKKNNVTSDKRWKVIMENCHDHKDEKKWILYKKVYIKHLLTGLCLDGTGAKSEDDVYVAQCTNSRAQQWQFDFYGDRIVLR